MAYADRLDTDILTFLDRHLRKDLLRFTTVGSVDDGKSTLIGRLLHDSSGVYEDQLDDARRGARNGEEIDFSLLTDGLRAEREQGITIDVAYRYFTTAKRKFIIADTPGHVQYTRNMATGASTADVAIILIDARLGVLQQSRRHAFIASLLGIPRLLVAVNKMDLRDYSKDVYDAICADFAQVVTKMRFESVTYLPVSALKGDNVVSGSDKTPWYDGPSMLEFLETVEIGRDRDGEAMRYPVQYVLRPHLDYRGFAGQLASGKIRKGDPVVVVSSGVETRIAGIDTFHGEVDEAFAPMSVTVRLEDEVDVSRGDLLAPPDRQPQRARALRAHLVWMHDTPLQPGRSYLIKHTAQYVRATIDHVEWRLDLETLDQTQAETLALNDIGCAALTFVRPIAFDPYIDNRHTGAFIVIDPVTNATVAAGMIIGAQETGAGGFDAEQDTSAIALSDRIARVGHGPSLVWIEAGDTSDRAFAFALERALFDQGAHAHVLSSVGEGLDTKALYAIARHCAELGLVSICVHPEPPNLDALDLPPGTPVRHITDTDTSLEALTQDVLGALARPDGDA